MSFSTPAEIVAQAERAALNKILLSFPRTLVAAMLAGIYIAMGGLLSLLIGYGFPEWTAGNPGLQKLLSGCMFPLGLILVVLAGAELFTGNNAVLIPGFMKKKYGIMPILKNWTIVYIGNFIGAIFFVYIMVWCTGIVDADPWKNAIVQIAQAKVNMSGWVVFLKGIGANWLVCLAVWLGFSAHSTAGKMMGLWFPVMCFVAIGYEHSIANMFFIPLGMLQGAAISWNDFILANLIPATFGNIVGGALFVGCIYSYLYTKRLIHSTIYRTDCHRGKPHHRYCKHLERKAIIYLPYQQKCSKILIQKKAILSILFVLHSDIRSK